MSGNHFQSGSYPRSGGMQPTFYPPTEMSSVSPVEHSPHYTDHYRSAGGVGMSAQSNQMTTMMMHNPKRPYRQRRKDPSCDACRERKVKCDATETTSCTECSSRNVRCQFTKDTNRRMSSIRQVQDLERQLLDAKQQLEKYRSTEIRSEASSAISPSPTELTTELPPLGKSPRRMLKAKTPQDLSNARIHLGNIGRGLLKPPVVPSTESHSEDLTGFEQYLPPYQDGKQLIQAYLECIHRHFPVVYWPEFHQSFANIYEKRTLEAVSKDFLSTLFAVYACGSLHIGSEEAKQRGENFASQAMALVDRWNDNASTTQATVIFLICVYLFETNRRFLAWIWLGYAIRIVQDRGYHVQGGQWSVAEGEMRKRTWYSFYVWDRVLSMELGKPMLIDDDECDTEYPDSLEEEVDGIEEGLGVFQPTLLLAAVQVARLMSPLSKISRSLCITSQTLHKFEAHLYSCLYLLPKPLQLSSHSALNPLFLQPIIYFQNTRLLLHRHNISPACSTEQRLHAINQCLYIAQDTATTISRTVSFGNATDWPERLGLSASSLLCTHLWRCMLFLVFRHMYEPFFVLQKAASAIGEGRSINISCGRYLLFFIQRLIDRMEEGKSNDLDQDEELLVYLSGDLQASTSSWVWGSAETGTLLSRRQKHGRPRHTSQERENDSPVENQNTWDTPLSTEEQRTWGNWQRIEQAAQHLRHLTEKISSEAFQQPSLNPMPLSPNPSLPAADSRPKSTSPMDTNRSRMNIASII